LLIFFILLIRSGICTSVSNQGRLTPLSSTVELTVALPSAAGFTAKSKLVTPERILDIWTEIVNQHALLASSVEYDGVNEVRFCYAPPRTQAGARAQAKSLMEVRTGQEPKGKQPIRVNRLEKVVS